MGLKIFNTLTRSAQEFVPRDPAGKEVRLYCCGPTVHDFAHIGNFRTFVFADLVRRYLEFRGYSVVHVMNITDVEDKIIRRIRESGASLREFTSRYETAFLEDLKTLGCLEPLHTPRATGHIAEIVSLIEKLLARGIAYRTEDGSVYFSIEKYRNSGHTYGQLIKLNFEGLRQGERVKNDEYAKESVADFSLWKARAPEDGDVFWPSPWGEGRPGWHIECSAMSMKLLGPSFDLHLGGEDLVFPHHEDEIAQSEGAQCQAGGEPFVKYWMHGAHLLVEGKKMSKSLGNYFTLRDLTGQGFTGREIRYLLLTAHYRESFNFTLDGLRSAKTALARIDECVSKLREVAGNVQSDADAGLASKCTAALDEDLNVSSAWGAVFDWVRESNRLLAEDKLSPVRAASSLAAWKLVDSVFNVSGVPARVVHLASNGAGMAPADSTAGVLIVPAEITALMEERQAARKAKDFRRSDAIRDELKAKGWVIEDTPAGVRLKRL
jgi:cysteinyl-tRNA synthetase